MKIVMTAKSPIVHGEFSDGIDLGNLMNFRHIRQCHSRRFAPPFGA